MTLMALPYSGGDPAAQVFSHLHTPGLRLRYNMTNLEGRIHLGLHHVAQNNAVPAELINLQRLASHLRSLAYA